MSDISEATTRKVQDNVMAVASGIQTARDAVLDSTERSRLHGFAAPVRVVLSLPWWVLLAAIALVVGSVAHIDKVGAIPESWLVGSALSGWVSDAVDWMVVHWDPFFRAINTTVLQYLLLPLERWLQSEPWWLISAVVAFIGYRAAGPTVGVITLAMMAVLALLGLFALAMSTLAMVIASTVLAVAVGIPIGIAGAKSKRFDVTLRPMLDAMQTMPSFVYLIPVLMLFGLGKVPAVLATVVYAVPPMIRFTNLGIRQVDPSVVEAAKAFGATSLQLLTKVQLPLAAPTIMAGLNQTIMMALAMVVIAAMVGAKGLGAEVLDGIATLNIGRGLLGGIGIVIMAVILDRITQGLARSRTISGMRS